MLRKLPGVKLNLACLPDSEIVIAAIACQGQRHDSKLFRPLLAQLSENYPQLCEQVTHILADAAHDDPACRQATSETLDAQLLTPINPRGRKPKEHSARGIDHIDPYGVPVCIAGHPMVMAGRDQRREQYLWVCPVFHAQHGDPNLSCSQTCKQSCSPASQYGRTLQVDRLDTPQIDWEFPQHLAS